MKITSNSQLLSSLNGLVDPNQRQQQQSIQDQQDLGRRSSRQASEEVGRSEQNQIRDADRQDRINANRKALTELQSRLKADQLEKLRQEFSVDGQEGASSPNLNLRESLGSSSKPVDTRPGQIIDIRV
ncbi:hypothetical protein [Paremcibacter congregatus]|uniref:hypothetical protein n=1 Tax=Paremcibacter congregatus TaxID=2043170 RepID=UPI003A8E327A